MVDVIGLEPTTSSMWTKRSNQLSYTSILIQTKKSPIPRRSMVGIVGLEPTRSQWPKDFKSSASTIPPYPQDLFSVITFLQSKDRLWWSWWDSNPRPLRCERSALSTELQPLNGGRKKTRTSKVLLPLVPETSASTNSAICPNAHKANIMLNQNRTFCKRKISQKC